MPKNKPVVSQESLRIAFENYYHFLETELENKQGKKSPLYSKAEITKMNERFLIIENLLYTPASLMQRHKTFTTTEAADAIQKCIQSEPTWRELSFLRKIIDCINFFGILPKYRSMFSTEKTIQKDLMSQLNEYQSQLSQSENSNKEPKLPSIPEESNDSDESSTNSPPSLN